MNRLLKIRNGSVKAGQPDVALPSVFRNVDTASQTSVSVATVNEWWTGFHPTLTTVVEEVIQRSMDVESASARLFQARPKLNLRASSANEHTTERIGGVERQSIMPLLTKSGVESSTRLRVVERSRCGGGR